MFDKLQQANRINDNGSWPYLRSHPLTTQRMADMQSRTRWARPPRPSLPRWSTPWSAPAPAC
jgi:predicted Zn-dependent protease